MNRKKFSAAITLALISGGARGATYREIMTDSSKSRIEGLGTLQQGKVFYSGACVIEREWIERLPEGIPSDFVESILKPAILNGQAGCHLIEANWVDIGSPELWWRAHFEFMRDLESDSLFHIFSNRILARSRKVAPGIWSARALDPSVVKKWKSPCYWGGSGQPPKTLGPDCVSYDDNCDAKTSGIGFGGVWVGFAVR